MVNNNLLKSVKMLSLVFLMLVVSAFTIPRDEGENKEAGMPGTLPGKDYSAILKAAGDMPVYGNWKSWTKQNGLPADKAYCVRIDGDRVLVGTSHGLAVYENGKWTNYTTEDGLGHNGVLAIDVSKLTGDVWLGTLGGLTRWSGGKFYTFTQLNSGMPNDVIYSVVCDGKDVWVATGGGAGHYDTYKDQWEIYMERNAPMHEPWTYGVCAGGGKIWIAAWGGGIIEFNKKTKKFRDYIDPDEQMELDVFPDDGVVHDITTGVSYANGVLWVATYFGVNWYDGVHWKTYFDKDSGLLSNFNNFNRAVGPVVYYCTDKGLSTFNGNTWVSYRRNENGTGGEVLITNGPKLTEKGVTTTTYSVPSSLSHNFVIGVDANDDEIWVATSHGVSRGERIK